MKGALSQEQMQHQSAVRNSQLTQFSLQSDKKRLERKRSDLEAEVRQTQLEIGHLKASLEAKGMALRSVIREIELADEVLMREKKRMNTL